MTMSELSAIHAGWGASGTAPRRRIDVAHLDRTVRPPAMVHEASVGAASRAFAESVRTTSAAGVR
jgi:hypothetical protein